MLNRREYVNNSVKFRPNDVNIDKSFIALVAPSLTGKTQSAFTINKIRPLYFNLGDLDIENQPIYLKFKGLSKAVKEAAEEDLESLKSKFKNPNWKNFTNEDKTLYNISSNSLEENFMESKFLTLGLLIKLIEDSELDEKGELRDGKNWMKFHAERNSFSYSAKSIKDLKDLGSEFLEKIRTKYYLFLDEFIGDFWAIFIRNLARCLQIGVVVANTNSNIANLIGKIHSNVSRGSGKWPVWSFVVVRLDLTDWEILNNCSCAKISQKLTDKIKLIIENSNDFNVDGGEEYNIEEMLSNLSVCPSKLVLFFRDFIKNEITKVRPGIAFLIADYIMNFELKLNVDLSKFIDELINEVKKRVEVRKVGMLIKTQGIMGNLALYLSNTYDKTIIKDGVEHRKSYLNDHLYYLNNPANEIDWMFLTFFSFGSGKNLRIHQKGTGSISNYTCEWKYELTYFDESELFTILICLFIKSEHSVAYDLEQGHIESSNKSGDASTTLNSEALKLDGNKFEVMAAVSIIDASHRKNGSLTASLSGQNGINFIKNVIGNIIRDENYLRSKEIYLKFPESTLEKVLENCRIPFLYPANLEIPQFLKRLTDEGTIKVGYCQRTSEEDKIDFKFAFEYMNSSCSPTKKIKTSPKYLDARRNIKKYYAVAECKNWTRPLNSKDLIKILEKSFAHKESFLSLLFCNEIEKSVKMNLALKNFCLENGIFLYKLAKDQPLSFTIESVHDHKLLNPEMICIIFETKTINNE